MAKEDCEAANAAVLGEGKASKGSLLVGDQADAWSWVPPGCSTQVKGCCRVYGAHWNAYANGINDGNYQRLCTKGTRHPAPCSG